MFATSAQAHLEPIATERSHAAPGKRTLTASLPARRLQAVEASAEPPGARPAPAGVDPFALHLDRAGDGPVADDAMSSVERASRGSGEALPDPLRGRFERSLGTDLGDVRVHRSAASADAAAATSARAFALGNDIHFAAGGYDPHTPAGQHLIAHEVAHTVQQRGASPVPQFQLTVSQPEDASEHEADRAAAAMVIGRPAAVTAVPRSIARTPASEPAPTGGEADPGAAPALTPEARTKIESDTGHRIDKAFTAFSAGCTANAASLDKKAKHDAEMAALVIDVGMGFLIPGLGGLLAGRIAEGLPKATPEIAADFARLFEDKDLGKALFTGATKAVTTQVKLNATKLYGDTEELVFLRRLLDVTQAGFQQLGETLGQRTDTELVAIWAAFDASASNSNAYAGTIKTLLEHYATQVEGQGKVSGGGGWASWSGETYAVMIRKPGTGHHVPALVHRGSGAGAGGAADVPLTFVEWIDPALEDLAKAKTQEVTGEPIQWLFSHDVQGIPNTYPYDE